MNREAIRRAVEALLPAEAVLPEETLESWPEDLAPPAAFLAPGTEEEAARILREAAGQGWSVLPAGSGTWLHGWGPPPADLVVSTRRLKDMAIYEPADLTFTAGAGMPMTVLHEATAANGQWLPLDPPGCARGTLGAMVANGVAGPLREVYGAPRDHILGLTLVSGDGRILRWGGRVVKNVAGFDVTRLTIGSRGALGLITSVSARLFPIPPEDRTLLLGGTSGEALLPLARELSRSSMPLAALELMEPGAGGPEGACLVVRLLGTREQLDTMEARILECGRSFAVDGIRRLEAAESRSFHRELENWEDEASLVLRMALLPSRSAQLLEWSRGLRRGLGMGEAEPMARALHVGWGVLRVAFSGNGPPGGDWSPAVRPVLDLRERLEKEGGSLTVSQGPGGVVEGLARQGGDGAQDTLVRGLKRTFDPAGILAPNRLGS